MSTQDKVTMQDKSSALSAPAATTKESSITMLRSGLAQLDDSIAELTKMSTWSELTIREHCDSIRQQVDIARETALENIHKASNTLMIEIDAYERECLSCWTTAKESAEMVVEDASKRMRASIAEQHAFLQSVQASDTKTIDLLCYHFLSFFFLYRLNSFCTHMYLQSV